MVNPMRLVLFVWAWSVATPGHAAFALGVLGIVFNATTRFLTSPRWQKLVDTHPHLAGALLVAKAAGFDVGGVVKALYTMVTGKIIAASSSSSPNEIAETPRETPRAKSEGPPP